MEARVWHKDVIISYKFYNQVTGWFPFSTLYNTFTVLFSIALIWEKKCIHLILYKKKKHDVKDSKKQSNFIFNIMMLKGKGRYTCTRDPIVQVHDYGTDHI